MAKRIKTLILSGIILLLISVLFASESSDFELVESALVSGGEKAETQNFQISWGVLGEVIGGSSIIEAMQPIKLIGTGAVITATGTIDDDNATLELEVDSPQLEYGAVILNGTWEAQDIRLDEGDRTITVTGIDTTGNIETEELEITVDTIPPAKPTLNPVVTPTASSPQSLSGTKDEHTSVWLNGEEVVLADSATNWQCDLFLQEGENPFTIFCKDDAQNASTNLTGNIVLDTIAPTVTITYPVNGGLAIEPEVVVTGTGDDDVVDVEVNGVQAIVSGNAFSARIVLLQEGWNEVRAVATDGAGNSFTHKIDVFLDTTPPYKPTINAIATPTNFSPQTISGTKDPDSALYLNGKEIIPFSPEIKWSHSMDLNEGQNPISLFVMDRAGRTSEVEDTQSIFLDRTVPITPIVTDDGAYLVASSRLHAKWYSGDPETDVAEYQFAIGTSAGTRDVLEWTSTGLVPEVTIDNLGLVHRLIYYFTVKARNFAGSWSEEGYSDGITVNKSVPEIVNIFPVTGAKYKEEETVRISVFANDADGDDLEYRFFVDDRVYQDWGTVNYCDWITSSGDFGRHSITINVRDEFGVDNLSSEETVFIYIEPVSP